MTQVRHIQVYANTGISMMAGLSGTGKNYATGYLEKPKGTQGISPTCLSVIKHTSKTNFTYVYIFTDPIILKSYES